MEQKIKPTVWRGAWSRNRAMARWARRMGQESQRFLDQLLFKGLLARGSKKSLELALKRVPGVIDTVFGETETIAPGRCSVLIYCFDFTDNEELMSARDSEQPAGIEVQLVKITRPLVGCRGGQDGETESAYY